MESLQSLENQPVTPNGIAREGTYLYLAVWLEALVAYVAYVADVGHVAAQYVANAGYVAPQVMPFGGQCGHIWHLWAGMLAIQGLGVYLGGVKQ